MATGTYGSRQIAQDGLDLQVVAQHMYALMLRSIASSGYLFSDPCAPGNYSLPGCIIASPSFPKQTPGSTQDYVFNWVRDGAITALEVAAAKPPARPGGGVQTLIDYVTFAQVCQNSAIQAGKPNHACFTIEGQVRPWSEQSDGPALQTLAILELFSQLDKPTKAIAVTLANKNVEIVLQSYQAPTVNLWEEVQGFSFFTRAVQLRCLQAVQTNKVGINIPATIAGAIEWLKSALQTHWNGSQYISMLEPSDPRSGYDPNISIVCACVYGAVPVTDTRLLTTAAQIRNQYSDPGNAAFYPINGADSYLGIGPMLGRYPGDIYDGDFNNTGYGHPWALCTANLAELYYGLANEISTGTPVSHDDLSAPFFAQVGVHGGASSPDVVTALRKAGDALLQAIVYHSDNLELSEQFDAWTGFERSVRNLTWSYAAFLSAVRRRNKISVRG